MNGMKVFWFYLIWILFFYLLPTFKQLEWWIVSTRNLSTFFFMHFIILIFHPLEWPVWIWWCKDITSPFFFFVTWLMKGAASLLAVPVRNFALFY
jgi:hypothetical protein